nr:ATP-binding protein [Candidatus Cloacimonadota bacterium]
KPFRSITIPHKDIIEGKLELNSFAADLWDVYQNRGPEEYRDKDEFFNKTYLTQGLQNLLEVVEKRLSGQGGDPVIQLQTPFGGGKTHSLISMYHKAIEWKAKVVVIVGTSLDTSKPLWEIIEEQLTGKIDILKGNTAPGRDRLRDVLIRFDNVLILMDELLEFVTKAAGVKIEESNLAAQTLAFMQELTEVVSTLKNVALIVSLPASLTEHFDEYAEKMFDKLQRKIRTDEHREKWFSMLQKVTGRKERIYSPVNENEISKIIRRRLFSEINEKEIKDSVSEFNKYAKKENILPAGIEATQYRDEFLSSYPFLPDVIDVLYKRWGSFPTFQRTRGVLRLLSLVIYDCINKTIPYISLADFNLSNQEVRRELLKHIEPHFDAVIAQDITSSNSGAKKINNNLGTSYKSFQLGSRTATSIFLYSHSGGTIKGATKLDIKRSATSLEIPSAGIDSSLDELRNSLFYLQFKDGKYFFTNQPNLNHILNTKIENVPDNKVKEMEKDEIRKSLNVGKFKTYLYPRSNNDIVDDNQFKLVILSQNDQEFIKHIIGNKGNNPRVYRNTLFFLVPMESEKHSFTNSVKKLIAYKEIKNDITLNLSKQQIKEVDEKIKNLGNELKDILRSYYRLVYILQKDGLKELDLGIPTFGNVQKINDEIYDKLISNNEIVKAVAPIYIFNKYLTSQDYVNIEKIYDATLKTPGELRLQSKDVLVSSVTKGVENGIFGFGELIEDEIKCLYFKEKQFITLSENSIIILPDLCKKETVSETDKPSGVTDNGEEDKEKEKLEPKKPKQEEFDFDTKKDHLNLSFEIPKGKVAGILGILNFLQLKFENVKVDITSTNGEITESDYENKIKEALMQLGINFK